MRATLNFACAPPFRATAPAVRTGDHFRRPWKWSSEPIRKGEKRAVAPFPKPSAGLEPATPSLPWQFACCAVGRDRRQSACKSARTTARRTTAAGSKVRQPQLPTRYPGRAYVHVRAVDRSAVTPRFKQCALARPQSRGRVPASLHEQAGGRRSIRASRAPAEGNARGRSRSARLGNRDGPSQHGRRARRSSRRGRPGTAG
jgi:hypothetical protein